MNVFFLTPFVASFGAAGYLIFLSQARRRWKVVGVSLVLIAAALQFADWLIEPISIHFLIPLLMQVGVCLAVALHASLEEITGG